VVEIVKVGAPSTFGPHNSQLEELACAANFPTPQFWHSVAFEEAENLPSGHDKHDILFM